MGPEKEKQERHDAQPQDLQDEGRTLAEHERPAMEDLGTGEREGTTEEHGG